MRWLTSLWLFVLGIWFGLWCAYCFKLIIRNGFDKIWDDIMNKLDSEDQAE